MDRFWKQFAGLGTASKHNVFLRARLKLTGLYVLIVAVIVCGFSLFLYQSIGQNLRDARDEDFVGVESHHHFVQTTLYSVENEVILADLFIIIAAAGLSFVLAGKTLKPIQLSVEAQKAFAANASHELRTPLAVMRNDIEVFLRNASPTKEVIERTMKSNLEEVGHMSGIVEDLLLLARSDNYLDTQHQEVDVSVVVQKVIERMKPLAESKKIHLACIVSGPMIIRGGYGPLERSMLNVIQNSIDHTAAGKSIKARVEKEGTQVAIRIVDIGSGIADKDLPHIFKRFYKGDSAKGTGLGLSIVKEIVDQHGGNIEVQSIEGKGTTVTLLFPLV